MSAILIASGGGCASSALHGFIASKAKKHPIFKPVVLPEILQRPEVIVKTHGYPPPYIPNDVKVLYFYCHPCSAIYSLLNRFDNNLEDLFYNFFVPGRPREDFFNYDVLNLEAHWLAWTSFPNVLVIPYETLHDSHFSGICRIEEFLNLRLQLKHRVRRFINWESQPKSKQLQRIFKRLIDRQLEYLDQLPNLKTRQPEESNS